MGSKGCSDLSELLKRARPKLLPDEYVFVTMSVEKYESCSIKPLMMFNEEEGVTLILKRNVADQEKIEYPFVSRMITMTIHSHLEAVGFTAAMSTKLAEAGISCNVVAAYYHDHIFVGAKDAERALHILGNLAS